MSHRTLKTSLNNDVNHHHHATDLSPSQKTSLQASYLANPAYPGIQPTYYMHLNGTQEELLPTNRYNCWGFTFNPRQCAIDTGTDVQTILDDNGTQVFPPNLRLGDVICYRKYNNITHTGRIVALAANGHPSLVQSKWGDMGEYLHAPGVVPDIYGTDRTYWRVIPLSGKGDAWVRDNNSDDRLPCPPGSLCWSPDLWLNNHGGTYMEDASGGQPNNIFVRITNADTLPISGAQARVYWSDPTTGMPHNLWHLIGTTSVNVPAGGQQVAGPITWTPDTSVPNHACLFAIINTGDDPFAAATLDPITWPFDWAYDNNIVWHNLNVIWANAGGRPVRIHFKAQNPLRTKMPIELRGKLEQIGPEQIIAMNLDPKIAHQVTKVTRRTLLSKRFKIAAKVRNIGWRQSGELVSRKGWRILTPDIAPGRGGRVDMQVSASKSAKPGEAYRLYIEQHVGGRPTGAITFVIIVGKLRR